MMPRPWSGTPDEVLTQMGDEAEARERDRLLTSYREARDKYLDLQRRADEAFLRWFRKRNNGVPTNGGQANRLADEANYASADLASAQYGILSLGIDPADVDARDGVEREVRY